LPLKPKITTVVSFIGHVVFEEKEVQDFPHDGGYTAKQEIFVVMKNTDREGSSRQIFGINTVEDQVTLR
jgi:hypothetical protein